MITRKKVITLTSSKFNELNSIASKEIIIIFDNQENEQKILFSKVNYLSSESDQLSLQTIIILYIALHVIKNY